MTSFTKANANAINVKRTDLSIPPFHAARETDAILVIDNVSNILAAR